MTERADREAEKRSTLLNETPLFVSTYKISPEKSARMIIRETAGPLVLARPTPLKPDLVENRSLRESDLFPYEFLDERPYRTISLSVTVYDRKISEILYRDETGRQIKAVSNIDFNYLSGFASFEDEAAHWSSLMMVGNIDSEQEQDLSERARLFGTTYRPKTGPDPSLFSSTTPEYIVYAKSEEAVPEELFEQLDALHRYYAANEDRLKVLYQRREALAAAHKRWKEANPPVEKDIIINFSPIR